jgi:hypothetical protein
VKASKDVASVTPSILFINSVPIPFHTSGVWKRRTKSNGGKEEGADALRSLDVTSR